VVPDGGAGGDLDQPRTVTIPVAPLQPLPVGPGIGEDSLQRGKTFADQGRSSLGAAPTPRRWVKQAGIQAQTRDTNDRPWPPRQSGEQLKRGETSIGHQDQRAGGDPSLHLKDELARPVGEQLGFAFGLLPVALGGRQRGEERQRPDAPSHGIETSSIRLSQRNPLVLTKWASEERTASR
jgi:hypothetical protein